MERDYSVVGLIRPHVVDVTHGADWLAERDFQSLAWSFI